jgi:hypothetical protein
MAAVPGCASIFGGLPDSLDRKTARRLVMAYPNTPDGSFRALAVVFAWGWSDNALGVARAAPTLNLGVDVIGESLTTVRQVLSGAGPVCGFRAMMKTQKVPGLGQAFGSKLLHFWSPSGAPALIVDSGISKAFAALDQPRLPAANCSVKRYGEYLRTMERWTALLNRDLVLLAPISAGDLEMIIFGFSAPEDSSWSFSVGCPS